MNARPFPLAARLLFTLLLMVSLPIAAQEQSDQPEPQVVVDEFNRGTPLRTAEGFLAAADAGDFERASEYLDLRNIHGDAADLTAVQLARRFSVIVERAEWVDIAELVDDSDGRSNDGLPTYRDSLGVVREESEDFQLLLQKVPRGDGEFVWKISNATVSHIPVLYEIYGYSPFIEELRRSLPDGTLLGLGLFKWVAGLAAGLAAYVAVLAFAFLLRFALRDRDVATQQRIFRFLTVPIAIGAVLLAMNTVILSLGLGATAESVDRLSPLSPLVIVWVCFAGIDLLRASYSRVLLDKGRPGVQVLLRPLSNALKLLIFIAVLLVYLDGIGINITTLLAGLGVGGVAVALALQKPLEDMFGAVTLYTQQPVRIGDFCRIGNTMGIIEEIGLRTTSIRTLANTLIAVPNAKLATEAIDNFSRREKILYRKNIRVRHETGKDQVEDLLGKFSGLLDSNERVKEGHRVRFIEIADDALVIEIYAYFDCKVWADYLELAESLNLQILDVIEKSGTSLAYPPGILRLDKMGMPKAD